jgi:hypothetical protein
MIRKPEDIYDALKIMALTNPHGKSDKEIAIEVRPDLPVEQAAAWLSKVTSRDGDRHMKPGELVRFCRACGNGEVLVGYLCDELSFERPARKLVMTPEKELKVIRQILKERGIEVDVKGYLEEHREVVSLEVLKPTPHPDPLPVRGEGRDGLRGGEISGWWARIRGLWG